MTNVRPTLTDIMRAVARLDEHADCPETGSVVIDCNAWNRYQLQSAVADSISFTIGGNVRLGKITKRDAAIMLALAGASPFTIEQHARTIAAMLRTNRYRDGKTSAYI